MSNMTVTKIDFNSLDIFPVFVDYDMVNMKCRGLSAKLDLFSYGALSAEIEKLKGEGLKFAIEEGILIRKDRMLFSNGFFLVDLDYFSKRPSKLADKIQRLNMPVVYIENSERYDLGPLVEIAEGVKIELLEF